MMMSMEKIKSMMRLSVKSMGELATSGLKRMKATWKGVTKAVKANASIVTTSHARMNRDFGSMVLREIVLRRLRICADSSWKRTLSSALIFLMLEKAIMLLTVA